MIFSINVLTAPYTNQTAYSAFRFTEAALEKGHTVRRVFFYEDGVLNASHLNTPPQDEFDLTSAWKDLALKHNIELIICIASALRRGIIDQGEAQRYQKSTYSLEAPFLLSGLGQLMEAAIESDRLITFS